MYEILSSKLLINSLELLKKFLLVIIQYVSNEKNYTRSKDLSDSKRILKILARRKKKKILAKRP